MKKVTNFFIIVVTLILFLNVGVLGASANTIKLNLPNSVKIVNKSEVKVKVTQSKYNTFNNLKDLTKLNTHNATSFNNGDGVMFKTKKNNGTISVNEVKEMSTMLVSNFKNTNELKFAIKVLNKHGVKDSEKTLLNLMVKANKTNGTVKHKNLRITNMGNTLMIDVIK